MSDDLLDSLLDFDDEDTKLTEKRKDVQRAPFGWPGGKYKSIGMLMKHLPYRRVWVDHFGGSGIVTINRQESMLDVYNDRYSALVTFYRCLRDPVKKKQLIEYLQTMPTLAREEFYLCKKEWVTETDDVIRSAKWYYIIRNSVIGKGHVFARSTNSVPPIQLDKSLALFEPIHCRFRNVQVENLDFEQCFKDFDSEGAVHYFDPPYIGTDSGLYDGSPSWNRESLERLLKCIGRAKGFCAMSGYPDEQIDKCGFWTNRITWESPLTSEVRAHTEENNKAHLANVQQLDYGQEVLWIRDK